MVISTKILIAFSTDTGGKINPKASTEPQEPQRAKQLSESKKATTLPKVDLLQSSAKTGGVAQWVAGLSGMHNALGSIPGTAKAEHGGAYLSCQHA